jgi:hypothetical protein
LQSWKHASPRDLVDEGMENDGRKRSIMSLSSITGMTMSADEIEAGERVIQFRDDA